MEITTVVNENNNFSISDLLSKKKKKADLYEQIIQHLP